MVFFPPKICRLGKVVLEFYMTVIFQFLGIKY